MCGVRVVQPKVVFRSGQHTGELNFVADQPRSDCRVWHRITVRRKVVEPIRGVVLAEIAGYLDDDVGGGDRLGETKKKTC